MARKNFKYFLFLLGYVPMGQIERDTELKEGETLILGAMKLTYEVVKIQENGNSEFSVSLKTVEAE